MPEATTPKTLGERFPTEIVYEILEYCIAITPETLFTARRQFWGYHDFRSSRPSLQRYSHLLLVSKRWYDIGLPFLYTSLWISQASHAEATASVLRVNPSLCRVVRDIRMSAVDDGFGDNLQYIVENTPNLTNVRLELETSDWAAISSIEFLGNALPLLSPTTLWLSRDIAIAGKYECRIASIICSCLAEDYTSLVGYSSLLSRNTLVTISIVQRHLHLCRNFHLTEEMAHIIRQCRQLRTIEAFLSDIQYQWPASLVNWFNIPSLQAIRCLTHTSLRPQTLEELERNLLDKGIERGVVDKIVLVPGMEKLQH